MIGKFLDILVCPETKNRLTFQPGSEDVCVENAPHLHYLWQDGILDLLPGLEDRISFSYDASSSLYDGYITSSNQMWALFNRFVWGFGRNDPIIEWTLSHIPDDFNGTLLDVPVGTGIFTYEKYRRLQHARLIVLDYSMGMLQKARRTYREHGIQNVLYMRGDVSHLPFRDEVIDFCLTMNGLHAFPDKRRALHEMQRVLKPAAQFAGCYYIRGQRQLTDLIIKTILVRSGTFTPPFFSKVESLALLDKFFDIRRTSILNSIFCFGSNKRV